MSFWSFLWFAIGASLTVGGALAVARGAEALGRWLGMSPVSRSLILVGFAASLPELAIVRWASRPDTDLPDLALGSLLGSVTANYLFALAIGALALPIVVPRRLIFFAYPLAIATALATLALAWRGEVGPGTGALLIAIGIAWPVVALLVGRAKPGETKTDETKTREKRERRPEPPAIERSSNDRSGRALLIAAVWILVGVAAVYYGPMFLLEPAESFATRSGLGVSTVGLTVIALLATLPEAILLLVAAERYRREAGVAAVVGSSLFNLTLGLGALVAFSDRGLTIPPVAFEFAIPTAIAATLACVPTFFGLGRVSRATGLAFFAFYVGYLVYLVVYETDSRVASETESQTLRFYAMFGLSIGVVLTASIVAIVEQLIEKARLADD